jgi:hypothetical protein
MERAISAEPENGIRCRLIDLPHGSNLGALFRNVSLIDADGIDLQKLSFSSVAEMLEREDCLREVWSHTASGLSSHQMISVGSDVPHLYGSAS